MGAWINFTRASSALFRISRGIKAIHVIPGNMWFKPYWER
jgi:hypothetical protein